MTMTTATRTALQARLEDLFPAIRAVADSCGHATRVTVSDGGSPSIRVGISLLLGSELTVRGEVRYGSKWAVEASGASWDAQQPDQLAATARALLAAASIVAILNTIDLAALP